MNSCSSTSTETLSAAAFPRRNACKYARGNQAAAAAVLGIIGAVGAYAAAREYRRAHQYRCGPYGCGGAPYGYYGGGYGYYGNPYLGYYPY